MIEFECKRDRGSSNKWRPGTLNQDSVPNSMWQALMTGEEIYVRGHLWRLAKWQDCPLPMAKAQIRSNLVACCADLLDWRRSGRLAPNCTFKRIADSVTEDDPGEVYALLENYTMRLAMEEVVKTTCARAHPHEEQGPVCELHARIALKHKRRWR